MVVVAEHILTQSDRSLKQCGGIVNAKLLR